MADFMGMMKQAAQLQSKMQEMQAELDRIEVEGTAGGGMVTVKLSAKGEMKGVKIDGSLIKPRGKGEEEGRKDGRFVNKAGRKGNPRSPACCRPRRRPPQGRRGHAGQDE